jgi:large subunit ribosomal protein L15
MNLTGLYNAVPSYKKQKRQGRGPSSGNGKLCGKGQGGHNTRSGNDLAIAYEGGQTPLYRKIPRRGFSNIDFKVSYAAINIGSLNIFENGQIIDEATLKEARLLRQEKNGGIKILAKGKLEKKLTLKVNKISKAAQEAVEKLGGKVELIIIGGKVEQA